MGSDLPKVHLIIATSLDGKVAGKFLFSQENQKPVGEYFKIYKEINPDAYTIGKTSLEYYTIPKVLSLIYLLSKIQQLILLITLQQNQNINYLMLFLIEKVL